ncbi:MAG: DNA polymerase III subunit gamma and tau, partial [Pseudarthrobacter sp.]|nr:DNA polymerase III subunit gamma and tau [Pseudarthrobacter sp.]
APAAGGPRTPLTPPRVSTSDWPVDEAAATRTAQDAGGPAAPAPAAAPAYGTQANETQASGTGANETRANGTRAAASPSQGAPAEVRQTQANPAGVEHRGADGHPEKPVGSAPAAPSAMGDVEVLRRAWPDVLQTLSRIKRSTWALVEPNAQVSSYDGSVLTLSFTTQGLAGAFGRADHSENLRQAIHKTVGIDCQVNAVAGGGSHSQGSSRPNSGSQPTSAGTPSSTGTPNGGGQSHTAQPGGPGQSSSDPNPKAPASPAASATSADIAWGLAPAPSTADIPASPAQGANPGTGIAPATSPRQAGTGVAVSGQEFPSPPTGTSGGSGSSAVAAAPAEGVAAPDMARPNPSREKQTSPVSQPDAGGDYSYSDDDWGPPRDEDAPPLDEEPPMDWEPSARRGSSAQAAAAARQQASVSGGQAALEGDNGKPAEVAHDPWTRAVEQAPGVWVVGDKSNVGTAAPASGQPEASAPVSVPRYEPATAQVPPSIPVTAPVAVTTQSWAPGTQAAAAVANGTPGTRPPSSAPAPEFAMAAAGSAPSATPAAPSRVQAPGGAAAPRTETRQSLYQRLSNSPEAAAGRAKAPSNVATAATYVQDIPSADDETIEESGVFGRAAVERILGGKLIEERSLDGSPVPPRY